MHIIIILILILILLVTVLFNHLTYGGSGKVRPKLLTKEAFDEQEELTLLTINMAHGRGDGRNQIFQSNKIIQVNVQAIGELIKRENADLVALQEADGPSWWSGSFSHVEEVAKLSNMHFVLQGKHVNGLGLQYGASVIGKLKVTEAFSQTFDKSIPTFSKGFVLAKCEWKGLVFDVVSLHLDFASSFVRKKQLKLLTKTLERRGNPMIIMGDFNTDMSKKLLSKLMKDLKLHTWKPNDAEIVTFPFLGGSRIDWVLLSSEFEIIKYSVLENVVSDHKVIKMTVKIKNKLNYFMDTIRPKLTL